MNLVNKNSLQIREISLDESMKEAHFFNSSSFLANKPFNIRGWQLINDVPVAQIFFYLKDGVAVSGHQSTFGSFDIDTQLTQKELFYFLNTVVNHLKDDSILTVSIRNYPSYFLESKLVEKVLKSYGFKEDVIETNQQIPVKKSPFESVSKRNVRKKINQCIQNGFSFSIEPIDSFREVYELVVETRRRKKYEISMRFDDLKSALLAGKDNYLLFTIRDGTMLIAASVSIIIDSSIIYNFYHADSFAYRNRSPLTLLVKKIYEYCQVNNYQWLDLGTSSINGVINNGLLTFKENLGAIMSKKISYSLDI